MKHLVDHPLFAGVSAAAMERLAQCVRIRRFGAGDIILRAGQAFADLHGLISGAARVELPGVGGRRLVLAPPQSFGEMSALSGSAVSATIVAQRDTETWVVAGPDLFSTLAEEPAFFRNVSVLLSERLRHRTRDVPGHFQPVVTMVVADATVGQPETILQGLYAGVRYYEPASMSVDARRLGIQALVERIGQWRDEGAGAQVLMLLVGPAQAGELRSLLEPMDFMLWATADPAGPKPANIVDIAGSADVATVRLGARTLAFSGARWSHALEAGIFAAAAHHHGTWTRDQWPELDRLVRQICSREIGLALSVGAAAGLAHLGLLEVLDQAGIPLDYLCGSSMGGVVSGHRLATDFARSKGLQWLPRAGLVSPARMTAMYGDLFEHAEFSELRIPAAVVAADLVAGRRVVLDSGSVALAAQATSAIPGLFPPVRLGEALLVDGGLVTRVPADLLAARRGGLKLAALIAPEGTSNTASGQAKADELQARLDRPFGLRTVLGASWNLLGWWDSAAQAQHADLVVRIPTPSSDGFNFRAGESLVECGRRAAQAHLSAIRSAVNNVLSPGAP
jgi:NTE family protein